MLSGRTAGRFCVSVAWAAAVCAGCGTAPTAAQDSVVPAGAWGGEHAVLDVTATEAHIEYDCAHGSLEVPLALDTAGRFDVRGMHVPEQGGPIREEEPRGLPARYTGRLAGDALTITATLTDSAEIIGTFSLRRNTPGVLRKCR